MSGELRFTLLAEIDSEPFDYDSTLAWLAFTNRVGDAIREHDPWLLLGQRPDCDEYAVDVIGDWAHVLHDNNIRAVRLYGRAAGAPGPPRAPAERPAFTCRWCHALGEDDPMPAWRILRVGDVVVSWACDAHLGIECAELQRLGERTELLITAHAAGATAPETTPAACPDCGGHGVRVNPWATEQEALEGLNVAQCPSCAGSGVAETTP